MFRKISKDFLNKRLTATNIKKYLQENYRFGDMITEVYRKQLSVPVFLQNNYGEEGDCTLTSILTLAKYYDKLLDTDETYNYTEKIAKQFLYNGKTFGTLPFFHKAILNRVFKHFNIQEKMEDFYFKGVGFNLMTILASIEQNAPVMLSLFRDGRGYYDNHTITVIGYVEFEDEFHKKIIMLQVFDNWHSSYSFVDYNLISPFSMICHAA